MYSKYIISTLLNSSFTDSVRGLLVMEYDDGLHIDAGFPQKRVLTDETHISQSASNNLSTQTNMYVREFMT